jgi:hypothetical protein
MKALNAVEVQTTILNGHITLRGGVMLKLRPYCPRYPLHRRLGKAKNTFRLSETEERNVSPSTGTVK